MAQARGTVGSLLVQLRADLGQLRFDVKEMESVFKTSFGGIQSMAANFSRGLASTLGVGFSVGAVVTFGKSIVSLAGHLQDLSDQTGISAQTLSGIKSTLDESGTSVDAFATGIFKLQKNLGDIKTNNEPAALAIKQLKLNLDELRNADTDKFLTLVTAALGKIDNPVQRASAGAALLGKQFRELAPAINAMAGNIEELRKRGITNEDVKILDDFGDAWTKASNALSVLVAGPLADLIRGMDRFFNLSKESQILNALIAVEDEIKRIDDMMERRKSLREKGLGFFTAPESADAEALRQRQELLDRQKALDAERNKANAAGAPRLKTPFVPLPDTDAGKKAAAELKKIMEEAAKAFADGLEETQKRWEAAGKDMIDVFDQIRKAGLLPTEQKIADINAKFDELKAKLVEAAAVTGQAGTPGITKALADLEFFRRQAQLALSTPTTGTDTLDAEYADLTDRIEGVNKALADLKTSEMTMAQFSLALGNATGDLSEKLSVQRQRIALLIEKYGALSPEVQQAVVEFRRLQAEISLKETFSKIGDSISRGIDDTIEGIIEGTQTLGEGMRNMLRNIGLSISQGLMETMVLKPIKNIVSAFMDGLLSEFTKALSADNAWAKTLGEEFGKWLKSVFSNIEAPKSGGSGFSIAGLFSSLWGGITGMFSPTVSRANGGMIPSFASGGPVPIIAHGGEFVMNRKAVDSIGANTLSTMNRTGRAAQGAGAQPKVDVIINGSITPNNPNARRDEIVKVIMSDFNNRGPAMRTFESRTAIKG